MLLEHLDTMKLFTEPEKSTWRARSPDTQDYIPAYWNYTVQGGCLSFLALIFGRAKFKAPSESRNIIKIKSPF